jgi:hypothetical protein
VETSPSRSPTRAWLAALAVVSVLAVVETASAIVAPYRAPKDQDWRAAAQQIRSGFRPGDLIVAAPAWADSILRVYLGDLIPVEVAGRMDDERYDRVWEVSQRGARSEAAAGGTVAEEHRFGALTVRRVQRPEVGVRYDFVARWANALVRHRGADGALIDCPRVHDAVVDAFQCTGLGSSSVHRQIVEVDTRLRLAVLVPPLPQRTIVIEYGGVPLGRSLVVATGLHNVWQRKEAQGPVDLRVVIDGVVDETFTTRNDDGWALHRIDTTARAGEILSVRFEITSPEPRARQFAFAAEARW